MKYDYLFLGVQRTGTSSIWDNLSLHTQIKSARIKEASHQYLPNYSIQHDHIANTFPPKKNTKVILEGTPNLVLNNNYINGLKVTPIIGKIKCLFTLRNPLSRMYSNVFYQAKRYYKYGDNLGENFLNEDGIIDSILQSVVYDNFYNYKLLKIINVSVGIENTLIINLNDLSHSMNSICKFLNIEKMDRIIPDTNSNERFRMPFGMIYLYREMHEWLYKRKQQFVDMMNKDYEQMQKKYGITFDKQDVPNELNI